MNISQRKEIAWRLYARISTGLMFVQYKCLGSSETPDTAWIRNIYILLSFYTELLLKAIFVMRGDFLNEKDLDDKLRGKDMRHSLSNIAQCIGQKNLEDFRIKSIQFVNPDYIVSTEDGDFRVEDFIDIRYDFIEGKVRNIPGDEYEMFRRQIRIMEKINGILKSLVAPTE